MNYKMYDELLVAALISLINCNKTLCWKSRCNINGESQKNMVHLGICLKKDVAMKIHLEDESLWDKIKCKEIPKALVNYKDTSTEELTNMILEFFSQD